MNYSQENFDEDDRMKKQQYLKQHILDDTQFDADEFVNYMEQAKPDVDGKDIDNWDFDELVEQVQKFKAQKERFIGGRDAGSNGKSRPMPTATPRMCRPFRTFTDS